MKGVGGIRRRMRGQWGSTPSVKDPALLTGAMPLREGVLPDVVLSVVRSYFTFTFTVTVFVAGRWLASPGAVTFILTL